MFHTSQNDMIKGSEEAKLPRHLARLFDDAADKPWDEISQKLTDDEKFEKELAGYRTQSPMRDVQHISISPEAKKEEERKQEKRTLMRYAGQSFNFTITEAVDRLSDYSNTLKSFASTGSEYFLRPLNQDDILRIKDGRIISADEDPEGKYIVRTAEEKAAFEAENEICVGGLSMDEIMLDDQGNMINANEFLLQEKMDTRIQEIDQAVEDLESGKTTVDALPEDIKKIIIEGDEGLLPPQRLQNNTDTASAIHTAPVQQPVYTPNLAL